MFGPSPPLSPTTPPWASNGSPVTQVSPVMKKRVYLPKLVHLCPLTRSHALSPSRCQSPLYPIPQLSIGDVTPLTPIWTSKSPKSFWRNCSFLAPFAVSFPVFATMATVFFYLHIFTGSVGRRILLVVPVDTLYRTSIVSSLTILPLNPFVNLSLAPLSLYSWSMVQTLGCGPTVGSPRSSSAPPSLGRGRVVPAPPIYHTRWRLHTDPFNAKRQTGKLWTPSFIVFWFDPTGNRTPVFRFSSRRSIHSTTDRLMDAPSQN